VQHSILVGNLETNIKKKCEGSYGFIGTVGSEIHMADLKKQELV
jgi:hypothetical protein